MPLLDESGLLRLRVAANDRCVTIFDPAREAVVGLIAIVICGAAISMRPATVRMGIRHRGNGMIVAA